MKSQRPIAPTRRDFLLGMSAGLAVLASSEISLLKAFAAPAISEGSDQVNQILKQAFGDSHGDNLFIAYSDMGNWVDPIRLLGSIEAFEGIYGRLGLVPVFSGRVNYREASQCTPMFKQHEEIWRPRYGWFTDVKRTPIERDIAYMLAGNFDVGGCLRTAEGATQFEDNPAISLTDDDPAVMLAASILLHQNSAPTQRELAHGLTLTGKGSVTHEGETVGRFYQTPVSEVVHIRRPPRNSHAARFPRGILGVRNTREPRNANSVYFAGLYL